MQDPPDILVTTPESLYLLLTSQAREALRGVEHVIVDEVHAMAGTKRGAHLALSLERLAALTDVQPQRIGLSATQRPLEAIAAFLGGVGPDREVRIIDAGERKPLELEVIVPVEDMTRMGEELEPDEQPGGPAAAPDGRRSIWPSIHPRLLELIRAHRSTLVFVNSRRLAERLAAALNELAGEELVRAHHGSIAREQRLEIEEALKAGRLPALVATSASSWGSTWAPSTSSCRSRRRPAVAAGLQRIGRAGHQVGEPSDGKIFPKYRGDLLEAAVVVRRMLDGAIEETRIPRNPLDVLAQQIVATCADGPWTVDELHALVHPRRAIPRPVPRAARGRARHALRPLPVRRVRRAAAARRLGPRQPTRSSAQRRAGGGHHLRRHHPGPRPVRRLPGRRRGRQGASRRRAGRGDGLRDPRRRGLPAGRLRGGSRRSGRTA